MRPADLYRTCRVSAVRLEALQDYDVPEDEARQRAFHAGEPLPPPQPAKLADLKLISELSRSGRQVGRVHDERGRVRSYGVANDGETVARCRDQYALALGASVPLAPFMTERLHP
jgi:hypothetical protein